MNTIVLMGRLARDPETKLTSTQKGQTKVSRFPLVVKRNRTSKRYYLYQRCSPKSSLCHFTRFQSFRKLI